MAGLPEAEIGVFGGSGFYEFLDDVEEVPVQTPFGAPSARVRVGEIGGRRVAFLARHGTGHEVPAHRINYRANMWALRRIGVRRVIGPCAVGSLQAHVRPSEFVVCDQLVDRTKGRKDTYFNGPVVNHISFAEPYCPELRRVVVDVSLVTDYDAGLEGVDGIEPVTMETIFKVLEDNLDRLRKLLFRAIPDIPTERSCPCGEGLGHLI